MLDDGTVRNVLVGGLGGLVRVGGGCGLLDEGFEEVVLVVVLACGAWKGRWQGRVKVGHGRGGVGVVA